jgi:hypothetical protein
MKKIVIVNGIIAGLIAGTTLTIFCIIGGEENMEKGMIFGYASMLLAFSLIFVGVKTYRDKHNNEHISFGRAFKIGLYITLIASTIYVICWMVGSALFAPDFMDKYIAHALEGMKKAGASQAMIDAQMKEMAQTAEMYKNPVIKALFTYMEIVPVGLLVSLIAALVLKRKQPVIA